MSDDLPTARWPDWILLAGLILLLTLLSLLGAVWMAQPEPEPLLFDAVPSRSLPSWTLPSELCLRSAPMTRTPA